jgi:5-methylcytosine-specific restriction endonuclease McrA
MRRLPARPNLSPKTVRRLAEKTKLIVDDAIPKDAAARVYTSSRQAQWFQPVIQALKQMTGAGERCMFCSGSESSQVEHFRPKAVFPVEAMIWENFFWICGICNNSKGDRFPPDTEPGERLINPVTENVWEFFFVDEFGNLTERWRPDINNIDQHAWITRQIFDLDRDALQQTRQARLRELKEKAQDALTLFADGRIDAPDLRQRIDSWVVQPFQPDVADYFLRGPGSTEEPFSQLLARASGIGPTVIPSVMIALTQPRSG